MIIIGWSLPLVRGSPGRGRGSLRRLVGSLIKPTLACPICLVCRGLRPRTCPGRAAWLITTVLDPVKPDERARV